MPREPGTVGAPWMGAPQQPEKGSDAGSRRSSVDSKEHDIWAGSPDAAAAAAMLKKLQAQKAPKKVAGSVTSERKG